MKRSVQLLDTIAVDLPAFACAIGTAGQWTISIAFDMHGRICDRLSIAGPQQARCAAKITVFKRRQLGALAGGTIPVMSPGLDRQRARPADFGRPAFEADV